MKIKFLLFLPPLITIGQTPRPDLNNVVVVSRAESEPTAKEKAEHIQIFDQMEIEKQCKSVITKAYDEVEDETYFFGKNIVLTKNRKQRIILEPTLLENGSYLALRISIAGVLGCVSDHSRVSILFGDGTRLFANTGNSVMNCDGKVALYFGGVFQDLDHLKLLREKPIKTIRVYTYNSYVEQDFTLSQANYLVSSLNCLFPMLKQ